MIDRFEKVARLAIMREEAKINRKLAAESAKITRKLLKLRQKQERIHDNMAHVSRSAQHALENVGGFIAPAPLFKPSRRRMNPIRNYETPISDSDYSTFLK